MPSGKENKILKEVWGIPDKVKGNCYVFSLGPVLGKGGYHTDRMAKAAPGTKCEDKFKCCYRYKNIDFTSCVELVKRIVCDNPKYVKKLSSTTSWKAKLPFGYHMMCAFLSPDPARQDFHFVRRFEISHIKKVWKHVLNRTPEKCINQITELFDLKRKHPTKKIYIWAHQRGWSPGGPVVHDAQDNMIQDINKINLNYDGLNYKKFCGFFSVYTRHATVTKQYDF